MSESRVGAFTPSVRARGGDLCLCLLPLLLLLLPLAWLLRNGTGQSLLQLWRDPPFRASLVFTLKQALLSTIFSVGIAAGLSLIWAGRRFYGRWMLRQLYLASLVVSSLFFSIGYLSVWGRAGWLARWAPGLCAVLSYSYLAIIFAHTLYNLPLPLRLFLDRLENIPHACYQDAEINGANALQLIFYLQLPQLLPLLLLISPLVFIFCFLSFSVALLLGGSPAYTTLELLLRKNILQGEFWQSGVVIMLEVGIGLTVLGLLLFWRSRLGEDGRDLQANEEVVSRRRASLVAQLLALPVLGLLLAPLLGQFIVGLNRPPADWLGIFRGSNSLPLLRSLALALAVGFLSLATAIALWLWSKRHRRCSAVEWASGLLLVYSPLALVLLLGRLFGWLPWLRGLPLLLLVHTLLALPLAVKLSFAAFRAVPQDIDESLRLEGLGRLRCLGVQLMMQRAFFSRAFLLAMALSMGEFAAALLLLPADQPTLPLRVFQLISRYGFADAALLGALQLTLFLLLVAAVEHRLEEQAH